MKSEPEALSISTLEARGCAPWDGVRNYQARNYMRDDMRVGDLILFYQSSVSPLGVTGIAKVASLPHPDHTQFDLHSSYYDAKATTERPIWFMVDVEFVKKFPHIITREALKREDALKHMLLWKHIRLSITPLSSKEFATVSEMGKNIA